jgi:hypothetical protein
MTVHPETLKVLNDGDKPIIVLDGGPAKSKDLDRGYFDNLERLFPGRAVEIARDMAKRNNAPLDQALEADWAATNDGLVYVHYYVGSAVWSQWDDVVAARITKRSLLGATATVQVDFAKGPPWVLSVRKQAAQSLVDIANERKRR